MIRVSKKHGMHELSRILGMSFDFYFEISWFIFVFKIRITRIIYELHETKRLVVSRLYGIKWFSLVVKFKLHEWLLVRNRLLLATNRDHNDRKSVDCFSLVPKLRNDGLIEILRRPPSSFSQ